MYVWESNCFFYILIFYILIFKSHSRDERFVTFAIINNYVDFNKKIRFTCKISKKSKGKDAFFLLNRALSRILFFSSTILVDLQISIFSLVKNILFMGHKIFWILVPTIHGLRNIPEYFNFDHYLHAPAY